MSLGKHLASIALGLASSFAILSCNGTSTGPNTTVKAPSVDSSLVAHYMLNGNSSDSSIYHNDGVVLGGSRVADRFGVGSQAWYCNGAKSGMSFPDAPQLNFGSQKSFTICGWFKLDSVGGILSYQVVTKGTGGGTSFQGFSLQLYSFGLGDFWPVDFVGTSVGSNSSANSAPFEYLHKNMVNRWHFFVMQIDRSISNDIISFDNASLSGTPDGNLAGNINCTAPLVLGGGSGATAFKGAIDDIRIYNRILSASEIDSLYHERGW